MHFAESITSINYTAMSEYINSMQAQLDNLTFAVPLGVDGMKHVADTIQRQFVDLTAPFDMASIWPSTKISAAAATKGVVPQHIAAAAGNLAAAGVVGRG